MAVGALKHHQKAILTRMGATAEVAEVVVNSSIPNAIRSGLGLKSEISLNGSAGFTTDARTAEERQI